ncbi:MAG: family 10 glycosylhydrolase [Deltaproteobacteria bacterium]|nr:family 10 glycosylhydrolase [Deltaproteobacteria bacterium]
MLRGGLLCLAALALQFLVGGCTQTPEQVEVVFVGGDPPAEIPDEPIDEPIDEPAGPLFVDVGHRRELRGAWVATVYGINWPANANAPADQKEDELRAMITTLAERGVNAVFFQVRPESDAMYASELEPWSRFLTGVQGRDPGFDPLAVAIETAHANNIELHAWMNPYRGLVSATTTAATNHVSNTLAAHAIDHEGMVWMDPSSTQVRAHVVDVIVDIVSRYDVDGIHFDDYFYPYPGSGTAFPDGAAFAAYGDAGGNLGKGDWRRDNVNALIADVSETLRATAPAVRFGVSPFGIYKNGVPEGIRGLDAYEAISCDPVAWIDNDWVDYLAPQLYWPTTQTAQAFGTLLPWWASLPDGDGRFVVAGLNLTELGSDDAWTMDEYRSELEIIRAHDDEGAKGAILYHADPLVEDRDGAGVVFGTELWATPALLPPVVVDERIPAVPTVTVAGRSVSLSDNTGGHGHAIYRDNAGTFELQQLSSSSSLELSPGRYAISAVGKNDRESQGVVVVVD